jgi:HEPN domain-containing protein
MTRSAALLARGVEYLAAAKDSRVARRWSIAYEEARTACELFAKAILLTKTGAYPRDHNVAPALFQAGLMPGGLDARELSRFLNDHTRGTYGFGDEPSEAEAERAAAVAQVVREHAEGLQ